MGTTSLLEAMAMEDGKIVLAHRQPEKQALARQMRRIMTPAEAVLWKGLRNNQLGGLHFRRQQVIEGFIVDFYCREGRLIIECDGAIHDSQLDYDQDRDLILSRNNLQVLRFSNSRIVSNLQSILAEIYTAAEINRANRTEVALTLP